MKPVPAAAQEMPNTPMTPPPSPQNTPTPKRDVKKPVQKPQLREVVPMQMAVLTPPMNAQKRKGALNSS